MKCAEFALACFECFGLLCMVSLTLQPPPPKKKVCRLKCECLSGLRFASPFEAASVHCSHLKQHTIWFNSTIKYLATRFSNIIPQIASLRELRTLEVVHATHNMEILAPLAGELGALLMQLKWPLL